MANPTETTAEQYWRKHFQVDELYELANDQVDQVNCMEEYAQLILSEYREKAAKESGMPDIIGLLRDCVSETWGAKGFTEAQKLFDAYLLKKKETIDSITASHSALVEENKRLKEALKFYADESKYQTPLYDESDLNNLSMPFPDKGHKARRALKP